MAKKKSHEPAELSATDVPLKTAPEVSGKLLRKVDTATVKAAPLAANPPPAQPKKHLEEPPVAGQAQATDIQAADLDDQATEQAVNDIAAKEADTMLALQDAIGRKASHLAGNLAEQDRRAARRRKWAWFTLFVIAVVLLLLAVPYTRYTCRWPVGIRLRATTDILPSVCK